jgi:hypothetical protein
MHHESALAFAVTFAAAAILALAVLLNLLEWLIAMLPLGFSVTLCSAVLAATGKVMVPQSIAAAATAGAVTLSTAIVLVLRSRQAKPSTTDTSYRAGLLPPVALLGTTLALAVSSHPAIADFGAISSLFLAVGLGLNLLIVPQAAAWAESLRGAPKPAS